VYKRQVLDAYKIYNLVTGWRKIDELLYDTLRKYPANNDLDTVFYKIELVDNLYNCNLMMDKVAVGESIIAKNLDLQFGNVVKNVNSIAEIKPPTSKKRVAWVFSSKYCHFHYRDRYPIYDKFARKAISYLTNNTIQYYEKFENFKKELDIMIAKIDKNITYKQIDIYLYLLGQWLDYKKGNKGLSATIRKAIDSDKDLFENLIPCALDAGKR